MLSNGKRWLKRILWFWNECNRFNKKMYYCRQVGHDCFSIHHDSLICLTWHVFCLTLPQQWWLNMIESWCYYVFQAYEALWKAWSELNHTLPWSNPIINLNFMVLNISTLSLNKSRGYFLVKWVDLKIWSIFFVFWKNNPVERYWGLQGAKNRPREFGWTGPYSTIID